VLPLLTINCTWTCACARPSCCLTVTGAFTAAAAAAPTACAVCHPQLDKLTRQAKLLSNCHWCFHCCCCCPYLQLDKLTRQAKLLAHGQFFNLVNVLSRKQLAHFYVQVRTAATAIKSSNGNYNCMYNNSLLAVLGQIAVQLQQLAHFYVQLRHPLHRQPAKLCLLCLLLAALLAALARLKVV
jgi:hypothetical protein